MGGAEVQGMISFILCTALAVALVDTAVWVLGMGYRLVLRSRCVDCGSRLLLGSGKCPLLTEIQEEAYCGPDEDN